MIASQKHARAILAPALRTAYCRLIEERVGLRLSEQQLRGLDGMLVAFLATAGEDLTPEELHDRWAAGGRADLFAAFAARLTIGETHFFRVAPQIAALQETVLPDLLARRADQRRLALWSAGCSSGEEPYTLAILLRDLLPDQERWAISILATDLSEPALDEARRACYREWSFRETPEQIRQRHFAREGDTWRLNETIRQMVRFKRPNLAADPLPAPSATLPALDLILCRNV